MNAELIKALRYCADVDKICTEQTNCGYYGKGFFCQEVLLRDAADALEAAEKRIEELEAQLPKDGYWIGVNPMVDTEQCSICGWNIVTYEFESNYCPNCGAKMDGDTENANTYSLGKIEMPKDAIEQIIKDGERKDGADDGRTC